MGDLIKAFALAFVGALAGTLAVRAVAEAIPPKTADEEQRRARLSRVRNTYEASR